MIPSLFRIILQREEHISQSRESVTERPLSRLVIGSHLSASGLFFTFPPLASVMALSMSA